MSPTIRKGDWFIATPKEIIDRGDIIVFKYPKDKSIWYVFRVVGLPNDTIEIRDNQTYVNGDLLPESYVSAENNKLNVKSGTYKVPSENYFVLGDNRDNSADSRFWGNVPQELVYGTYYIKYFHSDE